MDLPWSAYAGALIGSVVSVVVLEALFGIDWIPSVAHAALHGLLAGLWMCALMWLTASRGGLWRRRAGPRDRP